MLPLLRSMTAWLAAPPDARAAAVHQLAARHPRLRPGPEEPTQAHVPGLAWLTLQTDHGPLDLQVVPGGPATVGLSPRQQAQVEQLVHDRPDLGPTVLQLLRQFSTPPRQVELAPFLLAVLPVDNRLAQAVLPDFQPALTGAAERKARLFDDGSPAAVARWQGREPARLLRPEAVALAAGLPGLRLPSEAEWEHAMRGGQDSLFWWGDAVPWQAWPDEDDPPLGFVFAGEMPEACADDWHETLTGLPADGSPRVGRPAESPGVVRGGAADWSPFSLGHEWRVSLLAWRTTWLPDLRVEQGGMVARAVVRLAMDLPA